MPHTIVVGAKKKKEPGKEGQRGPDNHLQSLAILARIIARKLTNHKRPEGRAANLRATADGPGSEKGPRPPTG